jgi:hypothetical protein
VIAQNCVSWTRVSTVGDGGYVDIERKLWERGGLPSKQRTEPR